VGKYDRAGQATDNSVIWRICISYWITKDTETHTRNMYYVLFSTATMVKRTRLSVTLDVYCLSSGAQEIDKFCEVSISKKKKNKYLI